jgi:formylglycine-generating enzyme required for sulfatase activity
MCKASGKRLCTSEEWVTACQGPAQTTYPYGAAEDSKACNSHGVSGLSKLFGASKKAFGLGSMNHPWLNKIPGTLAKTGAFAACTNALGVYDMVGNLHEWTADKDGTFRGGYYLDTTLNGKGCGYATTAHHPGYHDYSTGFRCCADAE